MDSELKVLQKLISEELRMVNHNQLKEAILLLSREEIDYILNVSQRLKCTPLTKHSAITIYSNFMREYSITR